ncbi:MAG: MBL fold metallo-hydrolase [Candidatus Syntrophonatronum acetioxidans]|uniref:MBL fold metallo-hydrolase n=1 Tax=Candidatus Syntrophonatronum acetioxidans TaxID=1795816 RepID=A0A424YI14_9FIRM|nr:MAG: MBL fold metallo-hydrolase [Candidatus Syntrophonatronum acetioxidans]
MNNLTVNFLVENLVKTPGYLGEHGLSLHLNFEGKSYIFDTGQGKCLMPNLKNMGMSLEKLSGVILSHGHYDHTGGMKSLLKEIPSLPVMAHPEVLEKKYKKGKEGYEYIGIEGNTKEFTGRIKWVFNREPVEIDKNIFLTGEIPPGKEESERGFYIKDKENYHPDTFREEQALFIKTRAGVVAITGCAHKGVINTLDYIHHLAGEVPAALLGGTHLINAGEEVLENLVNGIMERDIKYLGVCHCTGLESFCYLKRKLPGRVFYQETGSFFDLSRL